ncbi:MAG: hypothetical protein ACD_24C00043G0001 [uncultured bacterium]|nr:MAG: hypothetical protein ACD_24C00043G0001 [uncultured bacterium]
MRSNQTTLYFKSLIKHNFDLSGKESEVLIKRLRRTTLEEIGKKFGITESRVRQIERTALSKIKSKTHQLALFKIRQK